ncbi:hypothetical protein AB0L74_30910 [Streptomyces sp. NPDC052020]|uniref:hypothetical protein n=1 Tax=Streptomyces sp. NPDC052020 TaxID=3155677 RepID=UPI00344AEEB8
MLPSPSLDTILDRTSMRSDRPESDSGNRRLVSVSCSTPDTAVFDNLRHNVRYHNARSGDAWDLAVAGYYAYGAREYDPEGVPVGISTPHPGVDWWYSPREFNRLRQRIEDEHHRQVARRRHLPR